MKRALLICGLIAVATAHTAAAAPAEPVEVIVTMTAPPLAQAFVGERSLAFSSFQRPRRLLASAPASASYLRKLDAAHRSLTARIERRIPEANVRWRYSIVLNGLAVVLPRRDLRRLAAVPGVERVWNGGRYTAELDRTPQLIGAPSLWGPTLATAGAGMKIAIVDDGIDQRHPFFSAAGFAYPAGFPKGQTAYTTPKVIVARAFPPPKPVYGNAGVPFDPEMSEHGTHVAGIAAGDSGVLAGDARLSGVAPRAYLGNYKALTIPSGFGLDGNAPELARAIEAAVRDGMDVINLSIGEVEVDPARDPVVRALDAAAKAGVVSAVAAGNDFAEFGWGSVGSPANTAKAIAVAAASGGHGSATKDRIADFSSAGPTSYSLRFKPDVTAPGSQVLSAVPGGEFTDLSGTSMAAPHVAGAAALLLERHPSWTPGQVKSALALTGAPVLDERGTEVDPRREGGGRIDLVRADRPLVFAAPTGISFGLLRPGKRASRAIRLTDAGGGAGNWTVRLERKRGPAAVTVPTRVKVPGRLTVRVAAARGALQGDVTGFIVLSNGSERRRIPFWVRVVRPRLGAEAHRVLTRPGVYGASTATGRALVSTYRYPEVPPAGAAFPVHLVGPEIVYRFQLRRPVANFGVVIVSRSRGVVVEPRIVRAGDENRLAGYSALPLDINPYRDSYGQHRPVSAVDLPAPGAYDIVFDTPTARGAGSFRFRFWIDDRAPPTVRARAVRNGALELDVRDGGAGVDPSSAEATIDGDSVGVAFAGGQARVLLRTIPSGRRSLQFSVADYQETKNSEDVAAILPNTRTTRTTVIVP